MSHGVRAAPRTVERHMTSHLKFLTVTLTAILAGLAVAAGARGEVSSSSVVSISGFGAIKIGMTEREAERAGGISLTGTGSGRGCRYLHPSDKSLKVDLMLANNRIVRVDLLERAIRASGGVRIGDSDASVRRRFAGRLRISGAKFDPNGFTLEVMPRNRSERNRRLIFDTDGAKVNYIRAGRLPEVHYVERCG